jgi:hypothetical protein
MSNIITASGLSGGLAAQTLSTDNNVASYGSSSITATEPVAQTTCAPVVAETLNQAILAEALNVVADTLTDTLKELADSFKQIMEERDQVNRIHFDYYSGRRTLDAFSNVIHAAHRKPKRRW